MLKFMKPFLIRLDQDALVGILKPHGFVLKDFLNEAELKKLEKRRKLLQKLPNSSIHNLDVQSEQSSSTTDSNMRPKKEPPFEAPEVLNYIKTRMLVLKVLLFRPLLYQIYKLPRDQLLSEISNSTFLKNVIQQGVENLDHLQTSLAKH